MKKIQVLALALFALLAVMAVGAGAAYALEELPEWLVDKEPVLTLTSVSTVGTLTLTDLKTVAGVVAIECTSVLDGSVGPNGEDEVTEVLNTVGEGEKIGTELSGVALLCKTVSGCENNATDIELWMDNLPWLTQLVLLTTETEDEQQKTTDGLPGYEILCLIAGLAVTDLCEFGEKSGALLANMGAPEEDVLATFNEENTGLCTQSNENAGDVKGEGLIATLDGLTLEVSEVLM